MKKLLIGSVALLVVGLLTVVGFALLGPQGVLAEEEPTEDATEYRFGPLDEVLDELIAEDVIDESQADAIRERMAGRMPHGGMHFRIDGFGGLPEGFTPPPGAPGTDEFEEWMDQMHGFMDEGGHMFRLDPSEVPFGGHGFRGHGFGGHGFMDFDADDLQQHIDQLEEYFGGELPEHVQDMIEHMQGQLSDTVESSFDA